jgi:ABC-type dipeptide/oligopeptide/nickel transport system permease component
MKSLFTHPFTRFVGKKAIFYLIVAVIALTFIFLIPRLMPGNPVDRMIPPGTTDVGRLIMPCCMRAVPHWVTFSQLPETLKGIMLFSCI